MVPLATIGGSSYAAYVGNMKLRSLRKLWVYELTTWQKDYKIVQLSDIHVGESIDLDDLDEILKLALVESLIALSSLVI